MKTTKYIIAALVALSFSACSMYQHTSRQTEILNQPILTNKTVVDVRCDFTKRVVAESRWAKTKEEAMQEANYNAIVNNNIDIVVSPIYSLQFKKRNKVKANLTGLAGYFENQRTITTKELVQELKDVDQKDIEKYLLLYKDELVLPYLYPTAPDAQSIIINADGRQDKCHETVEPANAQQAAPAQPAKPAPAQGKKKK